MKMYLKSTRFNCHQPWIAVIRLCTILYKNDDVAFRITGILYWESETPLIPLTKGY